VIAQELEVSTASGIRRGPAKTARIHHGRAPAAGPAGQPLGSRGHCAPAAADIEGNCASNWWSSSASIRRPSPARSDIDTQPTLGFQRVIQRAILHVQSSGKKEVTGASVLVAIYR
jgi:hypothetical protein